jgi:hypothetical protein
VAEVPLSAEESKSQRYYHRAELLAAILLSIAALLTSYASFQGELWDGEQATNYALAEQTRTDASKDEMIAGQRSGVDAIIFTQWLAAYTSNNQALAKFYRARFRPGFRIVFEQWVATQPLTNPKAPPTPFHMPGYLDQSKAGAKATQRRRSSFSPRASGLMK